MSENLKKHKSTIINVNFIKQLFIGCESKLMNTFWNVDGEIYMNTHYNDIKKIMAETFRSFNRSNLLSQHNAQRFIEILDMDLNQTFGFPQRPDSVGPRPALIGYINFSVCTTNLSKLPIEVLLKWFVLIYEEKIAFGGFFNHQNII
ncbi:hypothetical protein RF11_03069 [Thelohanellus kitauei]|uniref:Uncharacterized protein n=1 Tax=Thelohanellus kitauei TaxID=669202 RepID=A0A0C2I7T3_THEKT|nr:hypothetical protein RF11_03069 [Thelohanellus kitauei]